jgi:adenylate cyclase
VNIFGTAGRNRIHIVSGIVLATFVTGHFSNHALGLVSIDAMEVTRHSLNLVWRSWPGTILLYGALLLHFTMALDALYRRQSLNMPASEAIKIFFGLSLPLLLVFHVVGTRVAFSLSGHDKTYPEVVYALWSSPLLGVRQVAALIVAWTHGCLGMWFWLRGRPWFERFAAFFHMAAVVIPVLALLGFYSSARVVMHMDPPPIPEFNAATSGERLWEIQRALYIGFVVLIGGVLLAKIVPRKGLIHIRYHGGRVAAVTPGFSVLEASRSVGIPHASICGGRGRCSTCRIRIVDGGDNQPPPTEREKLTLASIGAPKDVRLACQLRPDHDLTVMPLIDAASLAGAGRLQPDASFSTGLERQVVALFCDIRGFTQLSEQKLPYDVVFLLNRYFALVGEAVESAGGVVDKFIGDGAIALFGLNTSFEDASRAALVAAVKVAEGIRLLNRSFRSELDAPLRIAMGLHGGPAIIGRIGYGKANSLTAVGDTINTASRLEGLAKQHDAELAVSALLVEKAGFSFEGQERQNLAIRGRSATLETWIIGRVADIAPQVENRQPADMLAAERRPV